MGTFLHEHIAGGVGDIQQVSFRDLGILGWPIGLNDLGRNSGDQDFGRHGRGGLGVSFGGRAVFELLAGQLLHGFGRC